MAYNVGMSAITLSSHPRVGRLLLAGALVAAVAGCYSKAEIINERPNGGTLVFSYSDDADVLTSTARRDAIEEIRRKCEQGYRIDHEGQIARVDRDVDKNWRDQIGTHKTWAMQFTCR
jgi:hypothetical protein